MGEGGGGVGGGGGGGGGGVYLLSTLSSARMTNSTFRLEIIMLFNGKPETSCLY